MKDIKIKLSALWVAGIFEEMMTWNVEGMQLTGEFLLIGAI